MKVTILGASGFVGTSLTERLLCGDGYELRLFSHSGRSAARLAARGVALEQLDVLDAGSVDDAIGDCDVVVNLVMGDHHTLVEGFRNVLSAAKRRGTGKVVHISSITAYGDPPPPDSVLEEATPKPVGGTYGASKLEQDKDAARFAAKGLDVSVLCPPIITGPHSPQLLGILECLEAGRLLAVEDGDLPCATIDVRNLAYLIELCFEGARGDGSRIFALDVPIPSWRELIAGLRQVAGPEAVAESIDRAAAAEFIAREENAPIRPMQAARHLLSGSVREALRNDATWARLEKNAANFARRRMPPSVLSRLRSKPSYAPVLMTGSPKPDAGQVRRQLRDVAHRPDKAQRLLAYRPPISLEASLADFASWVRRERGSDSDFAALLEKLEE